MSVLHIDFETRSTLNLKEVGLDNYAKHPTTDVWCLGYAVDDDGVLLWRHGSCTAERLHDHVAAGGKVVAHNVAFELAIWNKIMVPRYGWPALAVEQCEDTMAMAYAMALPGSLDGAAASVGLDVRKNQEGHRLMLQMCKPRAIQPDGTIIWWDDEERLQKLYDYCKQDVVVERELHKRLVSLSDKERKVWLLDYKINQRGIQVDLPAVKKAIEVVVNEQDQLNARLRATTDNFVGFTTEVARITKWVRSRGVDIPGLAKADVLDALELGSLPSDVRQALLIRQEAGRSSTAKLNKFVDATSSDGRLRNALQYHGAGTGRWAGRAVQLHNMPRQKLKPEQIQGAIDLLPDADAIEILYGAPMGVVSEMLRGMLVAAPEHELMVSDFANIEGRVVAWLAGEEWKLDAFRAQDAGTGPDIYKMTASRIYNVPAEEVTKEQRQIGKVAELACGYQGGVGAFQTMAKTYLVKIADELADSVKTKWRELHPKIVWHWYGLENAAQGAVRNPGGVFTTGDRGRGREVKYRKAGSFLWCLLPSGRALCYPYPKILEVDTPWGEKKDALTYMTVVSSTADKIIYDPAASGRWQRVSTYGGKLAENNTQAIARDILVDAMLRLDAARFDLVLHVHDEVVCESRTGFTADLDAHMHCVPAWAKGLPIAAEGWAGKRYRK